MQHHANTILVNVVVAILIFSLSAPAIAFAAPQSATQKSGTIPSALRPAFYRMLALPRIPNQAFSRGCATLPSGALSACFDTRGSHLSGKAIRSLALHLTAYGRTGNLRSVEASAPTIKNNVVQYRYGNISEWWRMLPMGFEQGFTIERRPAGQNNLLLTLSSSRPAQVTHGTLRFGRLRYGKLVVTDARGRLVPAHFNVTGQIIQIAINDARAQYPLTVDPLAWIGQYVDASDGGVGDQFGSSVAVDGNTALIGAYDATVGGSSSQGAVYVFTRTEDGWVQTAKLVSDDTTGSSGDSGIQFGFSVALNGNTALIGARYAGGTQAEQGAAYVFSDASGTWTQTAKLTAADGASNDQFGYAVALHGTTAMVGAPHAMTSGHAGAGLAYVFTESGSSWSQTQVLAPDDTANGELFGSAIAFDDSHALIGAPHASPLNTQAGEVYAFAHSRGSWNRTQDLSEPNTLDNAHYGQTVALSGTTAAIGAPGDAINRAGDVWTYTLDSGQWSYTTAFSNDSPSASDQFGWSLALVGNALVVGSNNATDTAAAAYLFERSGDTWNQTHTFSHPAGGAQFAMAVAFDGTSVLTGGPFASIDGHAEQGAAVFYNPSNLELRVNAPAEVAPGGIYHMQSTVTNEAADAAPLINVHIPVPSATTVIAAANGASGCDNHAGYLTCPIARIPGSGGTVTVDITFGVTGSGGESVDNAASIVQSSPGISADATTTVDNPPVASDGSVSVEENHSGGGTLEATDPDGDALTYRIVTQPAHGSAVIDDIHTGEVRYTPDTDYSGSDSFTWQANDGIADSNIATINLTVTPTSAGGGSGGGGGSFGGLALGLLALLGFSAATIRRGTRKSHS